LVTKLILDTPVDFVVQPLSGCTAESIVKMGDVYEALVLENYALWMQENGKNS